MKWILTTAIFLTFQAQAHVLNYKNVNTVAAIICESLGETKGPGQVVSKFKQDKTLTAEKVFEIELNGTCNARINKDKVEDLGREISLTFYSHKNIAEGQVGFHKIKIKHTKDSIVSIELIDTLLGENKSINLSRAQWSPNNMIFTTSPIKVALKSGVKIQEKSSALNLGSQAKLYNLWNYESYACSNPASKDSCSKLVSKI